MNYFWARLTFLILSLRLLWLKQKLSINDLVAGTSAIEVISKYNRDEGQRLAEAYMMALENAVAEVLQSPQPLEADVIQILNLEQRILNIVLPSEITVWGINIHYGGRSYGYSCGCIKN